MNYHRLWLVAGCLCLMFSLQAKEQRIGATIQDKIRPSYPFPEFLSTGPYIWYKDAEKSPIKGHAYRLATFTVDGLYRVFLEKVNFGDNGCCLEIVDYRELNLTPDAMARLFPAHNGKHGFKLIRWNSPLSFTFSAYGGEYILSEIDTNSPLIKEIGSK
jgi:hypothetical protein